MVCTCLYYYITFTRRKRYIYGWTTGIHSDVAAIWGDRGASVNSTDPYLCSLATHNFPNPGSHQVSFAYSPLTSDKRGNPCNFSDPSALTSMPHSIRFTIRTYKNDIHVALLLTSSQDLTMPGAGGKPCYFFYQRQKNEAELYYIYNYVYW